MTYRIGLYFAAAIILCGYAAAADEPRQTVVVLKTGAECPGIVLDATNGVVCLFTYPTIDDGSQQTFVALESGADCPGLKLEKTVGIEPVRNFVFVSHTMHSEKGETYGNEEERRWDPARATG